jgi:pilus assembly protein Flp/PilA
MNTLANIISYFSSINVEDEGASMVEYGLLVAFIAVVALVGVTALGINVNNLFAGISF